MKVKIQVDGSVHRALRRLGYYGGEARAMQIRSHQYTHQRDLAKCLRYGLMNHKLRGPYIITEDGTRVLAELEAIHPAECGRAHREPWEVSYRDNPWGYGVPHRLGEYLTTEVPGNEEWQRYFENNVW